MANALLGLLASAHFAPAQATPIARMFASAAPHMAAMSAPAYHAPPPPGPPPPHAGPAPGPPRSGGIPPPPPPQQLPVFNPVQIDRDTAQLNHLLSALSQTRFTTMAGKFRNNKLPRIMRNAADPFTGTPIPAKFANEWPGF